MRLIRSVEFHGSRGRRGPDQAKHATESEADCNDNVHRTFHSGPNRVAYGPSELSTSV